MTEYKVSTFNPPTILLAIAYYSECTLSLLDFRWLNLTHDGRVIMRKWKRKRLFYLVMCGRWVQVGTHSPGTLPMPQIMLIQSSHPVARDIPRASKLRDREQRILFTLRETRNIETADTNDSGSCLIPNRTWAMACFCWNGINHITGTPIT